MADIVIYAEMTNPYMRLVRVADGGIVVAATGVISLTTSWATSYTTLAWVTLLGGIPVTIPTGLQAGDYDMLFYDAASPADSDQVQIGKRIQWSGHQLIGLPVNI